MLSCRRGLTPSAFARTTASRCGLGGVPALFLLRRYYGSVSTSRSCTALVRSYSL